MYCGAKNTSKQKGSVQNCKRQIRRYGLKKIPNNMIHQNTSPKGNTIYCGYKDVKTGKRIGTLNECKQKRQVRLWGVETIGGDTPQPQTREYKLSQELFENGVAVVPVEWVNKSVLKSFRSKFENTCDTFPEFIQPVKDKDYVLGGFNALGNPSSFHNHFVRDLRVWSMWSIVPVLKHLANGRNIEQVVDRMLFRPHKQKTTRETYHRDEAENALPDDDIFGGWWNIDSVDQYFSCVPKTHKLVNKHRGFAAIKNKNEIAEYEKTKVLVKIPPGHIMIFYEKLVHEIVPKPAPVNGMIRLFLGWRLTHSKESLFTNDTLLDALKNQSVMKLKSGQTPPMYAKLHWTNWRKKIVDFSTQVKDLCKEEKTVKSGKNKNKKLLIVHKEMKSLREYGLPLYTTYKPYEKRLLMPNTRWNLPKPNVSSFGSSQSPKSNVLKI